MSTELKTLVDGVKSAFEEHKKTNDARIAALEKGQSTADFDEKLAKIGSDLDAMQEQLTKASRLPQGKAGEAGESAEQLEHRKSFGGFVRKGREDGLRDLEQKAMSVGSDPDGGYLVPVDMSGRIIKRVFDTTPMRQVAGQITISTDRLEGMVDRDEVSSGWAGETSGRTETDTPELGKYSIEVHEMFAEPRITQKLLDDAAFPVEVWLGDKVADKFARVENAAFVTANGVDKPRGFASYETAATGDSTRTWGTLEHVKSGANGDWAATNPSDKLLDLIYAMNPAYRQGAVWMMPRLLQADIRKFKDGNGQYIWQPGLQAGQPASLLGFPVYEAEDMAAKAANSLSVAFGNFREGYLIVDRMGIRVLRDPFTAKPYVKFYTTKRVGGRVTNFDAIKFLKFSA